MSALPCFWSSPRSFLAQLPSPCCWQTAAVSAWAGSLCVWVSLSPPFLSLLVVLEMWSFILHEQEGREYKCRLAAGMSARDQHLLQASCVMPGCIQSFFSVWLLSCSLGGCWVSFLPSASLHFKAISFFADAKFFLSLPIKNLELFCEEPDNKETRELEEAPGLRWKAVFWKRHTTLDHFWSTF